MADLLTNVKTFILDLSKELVDNKEKVLLKETFVEPASIVELHVDKEDIGKLIGRKGRTADALRTILNAAALKQDKRFILHIMEGE
jgi:uncharacterized protein